jgi:hypothetical protein
MFAFSIGKANRNERVGNEVHGENLGDEGIVSNKNKVVSYSIISK